MKHHFTRVCVSCLTLTVMGCGGESIDANPVVPPTFAEANASANALTSQFVDASGQPLSGVTPTDSAALPTADSSTYNGYMNGTIGGNGVVSEVTLSVNFGTNEINASASNFIHETNGAIAGTLNGTGNLNVAGPSSLPLVTVSVSGQLTQNGSSVDASFGMDGEVFDNNGDSAGAIAGAAEGGIDGQDLTNGVFAATR